jgi:membrane protease YdiL (CAAX protease family)
LWVPTLIFLAYLIAPRGVGLVSVYAARWYAVAVIVLAVIGRQKVTFALAASVLAGGAGIYLAVWAVLQLLVGGDLSYWLFVVYGIGVVAGSAVQAWRIARRDSTWDPVLLLATVLYAGAAAEWAFFLFNGRGLDYRSYAPETLVTPFVVGLSLIAMAFASVGAGVTRPLPATLDRLGLMRPRPWQVALAIGIAALLVLAEHGVNAITRLVAPVQYREIGLISYYTFANLPWWVYVTFAIVAGITEETLYRGAVQPRFGIVATSALFAFGHIQYGATPVLLGVFAHGIIYGLLRRYANTTTSAIAHSSYDLGEYLALAPTVYVSIVVVMALLLVRPVVRNRETIREALTRR